MPGLVQVGAVEQGDELRVLDVVVPGEFGQAAQAFNRRQVGQVQMPFGFTDVGIRFLQHRQKKIVLAGEVIVDQPLVQVGPLGDPVHPRAAQPMQRKLIPRGQENRLLGAVCVAGAGFGRF